MLLSGGWTPGFSSGFGNLRNPQVILEVPRSPGRAEELQLDFYLSIPTQVAEKESRESDRKRPSPALTVFSHQDDHLWKDSIDCNYGPRKPGPPDRLLEGQLRQELGASKASIGGYVTAQVVLSGAEARKPLYVVLQNSEPNETLPWQLRVLVRIRPCLHAANGKVIPAAASLASAEEYEGLGRPLYEAEVPDDPPIRCAIVGGTAEVNHIYACWPENLALYLPKPNRGEILGSSERVVSWIPSRRVWGKDELIKIESSLGPHPLPMSPSWPPAEPLILPDDDVKTSAIAVSAPSMMLANLPKAPSATDRVIVQAHVVVDPVEDANNELPTPLPPARRMPPKIPQTSEIVTPPSPAQLCGAVTPPGNRQQEARAVRAHAVESHVRGTSKERLESVSRGKSMERRRQHDQASRTSETRAFREGVDTQSSRVHSERHARVEALLRRRRQGYGSDSSPRSESLSQPPQVRSGRHFSDEMNSDRGSRPPMSKRYEAEALDQSDDSPRISLPHPPLTTASPRGGATSVSAIREARYRAASSSASQEDNIENHASQTSTPKGASSLVQASVPLNLPKLKTSTRPHADDIGVGEKHLRCCHFSGHPVFCCQAEAQRSKGPTRHIVKLERRPGADRLGFGNVAAGPKDAPVLVISWVRDGALAAWNDEAPEGLRVPPQSAIVSVNGVSADVQAMREQLRAPLVEMEVIAPDRWRWNQVVNAS